MQQMNATRAEKKDFNQVWKQSCGWPVCSLSDREYQLYQMLQGYHVDMLRLTAERDRLNAEIGDRQVLLMSHTPPIENKDATVQVDLPVMTTVAVQTEDPTSTMLNQESQTEVRVLIDAEVQVSPIETVDAEVQVLPVENVSAEMQKQTDFTNSSLHIPQDQLNSDFPSSNFTEIKVYRPPHTEERQSGKYASSRSHRGHYRFNSQQNQHCNGDHRSRNYNWREHNAGYQQKCHSDYVHDFREYCSPDKFPRPDILSLCSAIQLICRHL